MPATFSLSDSPRVRYATGAMLYFAQGIPQGLLGIAIPAWLASQGTGAAEIASYCSGIWFDGGEVEVLRNKEAAVEIDKGSAATGKQYNLIDEYACPRCGGEMTRKVDPQQRHIHYETCSTCEGSFFDAGEFRDLSQLTISDFFKRFVKTG